MAVFPGLGTEDNTCKVVETAASVVAVLMLTSGVSVVDTDESTLRSTFVRGSAMWFFPFEHTNIDFENAWSQLAWDHFFPYLNEKKESKKLGDDK